MSVTAPAHQSAPAQPPTPDSDEGGSLHDLAVDAQTDIQKLATGLAHAGANPQVVSQITQMGAMLAQVAKVLNQSPDVEAAAKNGHPAMQEQAGGPQAPQGGPPNAAPGPAPQGAAPGAPQPPAGGHTTPHSATIALHHDMQQSASQRR